MGGDDVGGGGRGRTAFLVRHSQPRLISSTYLETTRQGGHLCRWLPAPVSKFCASILSFVLCQQHTEIPSHIRVFTRAPQHLPVIPLPQICLTTPHSALSSSLSEAMSHPKHPSVITPPLHPLLSLRHTYPPFLFVGYCLAALACEHMRAGTVSICSSLLHVLGTQ